MAHTRETGLDAGEGVFLYAVVSAGRDLPELVGLDDSLIELVELGQVAAVVSKVGLDRTHGRRADLVAYNEVVAGLAESGVVAPIRFGTVLADRDAVIEEVLGPQERLLTETLRDLTDHLQFNLRATYVESAVLQEIVETEPQIQALRDQTRDLPEDVAYGERVRMGELVVRSLELRSETDAADLLDAVLPLVAAHAPRTTGGLDSVLNVALLVHESRVEAFEEALEGLAEAVHERIHLRLVGPLAPYDFVGEF